MRFFHADLGENTNGRKIFLQCEAGFPMMISSSSGEVQTENSGHKKALWVSEQESIGVRTVAVPLVPVLPPLPSPQPKRLSEQTQKAVVACSELRKHVAHWKKKEVSDLDPSRFSKNFHENFKFLKF